MSVYPETKIDTPVEIADRFGFKLTSLREQVLQLLLAEQKPIKAYDLLAKLKEIRPSAKPPTVYRVLDYLVERKAVIRLEACNSYIISRGESFEAMKNRMIVVFRCGKNGTTKQFSDPDFDQMIMRWENEYGLRLDSGVIELQGEFLPEHLSQ